MHWLPFCQLEDGQHMRHLEDHLLPTVDPAPATPAPSSAAAFGPAAPAAPRAATRRAAAKRAAVAFDTAGLLQRVGVQARGRTTRTGRV